VLEAPPVGLRILSVEDERSTVDGLLDTLNLDGHDIQLAEDVAAAQERLSTQEYDLLIADQRLGPPPFFEAGVDLVCALKEGAFGELNRNVPFVFVTGSEEWVERGAVEGLGGYRGILLKGGALTPKVRETCWAILNARKQAAGNARYGGDMVREKPAHELDRVLVRIISFDDKFVEALIPSWDLNRTVLFPVGLVPDELVGAIGGLAGRRVFGWMDLSAVEPRDVILHDLHVAPAPDEDDGLA
jgi:CheY-like chemotaxis protein